MRKFNALRRVKKMNCLGKKTATDLNSAKKTYVDAAIKKGQTRSEAEAKANKVINGKCTLTKVSSTKRRKRTAKK